MKKPIVKNQHYVPRLILKNFATGKKDQVYVYDKLGKKYFPSNYKNVASETYFYDFEINDAKFTYEQAFEVLESNWGTILKKIIRDKSLENLADDELYELAHLGAVQFARTRKMRNMLLEMEDIIVNHVEKMGHTKDDIKDYVFSGHELAPMKELQMMMDSIPEFTRIMSLKHIALAEAPRTSPLMISDHPVVMDNNILEYSPHRGNLGLAVMGVEIYLPIHPQYALWFICPIWAETIKKSHKQIFNLFNVSPQALQKINTKSILEMYETIYSRKPFKFNHDNVIRLNSIQAKQSTRFIFSHSDDFSLLTKMQAAGHINETGRTLEK